MGISESLTTSLSHTELTNPGATPSLDILLCGLIKLAHCLRTSSWGFCYLRPKASELLQNLTFQPPPSSHVPHHLLSLPLAAYYPQTGHTLSCLHISAPTILCARSALAYSSFNACDLNDITASVMSFPTSPLRLDGPLLHFHTIDHQGTCLSLAELWDLWGEWNYVPSTQEGCFSGLLWVYHVLKLPPELCLCICVCVVE